MNPGIRGVGEGDSEASENPFTQVDPHVVYLFFSEVVYIYGDFSPVPYGSFVDVRLGFEQRYAQVYQLFGETGTCPVNLFGSEPEWVEINVTFAVFFNYRKAVPKVANVP